MSEAPMKPEDFVEMIRSRTRAVPPASERAAPVDPLWNLEHSRSTAVGMPVQSGALDETTRTLIYLAAALAGSSPASVRAMADKVVQQRISSEKVMETVQIVCLAMATKIMGDSEPVFDALKRGLAKEEDVEDFPPGSEALARRPPRVD